MQDNSPRQQNFTTVALAFEGGLAILALLLGWLLQQPPLESVSIAREQVPQLVSAVFIGLAATLPLVIAMWVSDRMSLGPFHKLSRIMDGLIVPMFRSATVFDLAAISLAAGLGEEMLFRGLLQSWVAGWTGEHGTYIGIAAASVIFGLCHFVTPLYAVMACLVGVYLGWLFVISGNLAAPIVCHAAYDFVALLYFCRWRTSQRAP